MRGRHLLFTTVTAATFAALVGSVDAADSTSAPHPNLPWQQPMARGLGTISTCPTGQVLSWNGSAWACTNTVANAQNATSAAQLGGVASCPSGQVVYYNNGAWGCTNTVANAGYATSAGSSTTATNANYATSAGSAASANYASSSGYASTAGNGVASTGGTTLTTQDGTQYALPSGGGSGGSGTMVAYCYANGWGLWTPGQCSGASASGLAFSTWANAWGSNPKWYISVSCPSGTLNSPVFAGVAQDGFTSVQQVALECFQKP